MQLALEKKTNKDHFYLNHALKIILFIFQLMDIYHNEKVVGQQQRKFGSVRDEEHFFMKPISN